MAGLFEQIVTQPDNYMALKLLNQRWEAMKQERSSWWGHWMDISNYLLPRSGRYFVSDRNRGWKRNNSIYDSTGTRALSVLASGMMSYLTSPSRPWFRIEIGDGDLMQQQDVKQWLSQVTALIEDVLARSNTYRALHGMYEELGAFGTAGALIGDDYQNVIHLYPFTIGEYCIGTDWRGQVQTLYREFDKTIGEIVREFGYDRCSVWVKGAYDRGDLHQWVTIRHGIEPRDDREPGKMDALNMPYRSCYWEAGRGDGHLLRESGFKSFPCVVPRWATQGGDIYGNSPGMEALGDIKQLQQEQLRKSQAIDYQVQPPLALPTSMQNQGANLFPGGTNYVDMLGAGKAVQSLWEVELDLRALLEDVQDVRGRINASFYVNMFLMLEQAPANMTATEVAQRAQEKMLMLGPVIERLNNELLDPLITSVFDRLLTAGLLPTPPDALQGQSLNIEYVSMLAQAQKSVALGSMDRFVSSLGMVAQVKPDVLDKFNGDAWADIYADKLGINPELVVSGKQLAVIRQAKAQAQQQMQQAALLQQGADVAQKVGGLQSEGTLGGAVAKRMGVTS